MGIKLGERPVFWSRFAFNMLFLRSVCEKLGKQSHQDDLSRLLQMTLSWGEGVEEKVLENSRYRNFKELHSLFIEPRRVCCGVDDLTGDAIQAAIEILQDVSRGFGRKSPFLDSLYNKLNLGKFLPGR